MQELLTSNVTAHPESSLSEAVQITDVKPNPEFIQKDLYFGRNIGGVEGVSEAEFQAFLREYITPRFPDGLTVYDADGQFLDSTRTLIQEPSKVVSLIFEDTPENEREINEIVDAYEQKFHQESVLQVVNEDDLKIGFGQSEDLIDNDPNPELIQEDLYFGRNIDGVEGVSEEEFRAFLSDIITPRFPDGLTVYDADGQFLDSTGKLLQEPSKVVSLIFEDTTENEAEIDEIIKAYKQQFQQESVLQVVNEDVKVGFGQSEDLIDNDPNPELIQEDLYFGRNIGGVEGVSEAEFQAFLSDVITPRFPDGLTVYDADGQFLGSTGTLIQEPSKVVSLIFEDTTENEREIDEIIEAYKQKFQQESVLQVVDEDLEVAFTADAPVRDGLGGQQSFVINGGESVTITNFGGIGRGTHPNQATVGEADTLVFYGEGLTAKNMLLTQEGNDLAIAFAGVTDTEVVLKDFSLDNLDNLQKSTGGSINLGNIQFDGQNAVTDSFDIFNAEWNFKNIFNCNSVTFLNNLDNTISGFNSSNDVINGQGGDDIIKGLSGDDLLRGGEGNDKLFGYAGSDTLVGDAGNDWLNGGSDRDIFVLTTGNGTDTITDFENGVDLLDLAGNLTFGQLTITQGIGVESGDTLISLTHADKMLAILIGVQASTITSADFTCTESMSASEYC